jgi:MFS family permease
MRFGALRSMLVLIGPTNESRWRLKSCRESREASTVTQVKPSVASPPSGGPLSPLRHRVFAVVWSATVISNVGSWLQSAAAGWLMTDLTANPRIVALVQVASYLPMFLFVLPAGALADVLDRRRLLLVMEVVGTALAAGFALLVQLNRVGPVMLLAFIVAAGIAEALATPGWQAIVPQLVPREDLGQAIALNGVGINISRAIGPALAGIIIVDLGTAAPYWLNAVSNLAVVAALLWWRVPPRAGPKLPPERLGRAMGIGLRYARHSPHLRATIARAAGFFVFASAYWALLPLLARIQLSGGARLYGLLLGAIGLGAIVGAFALPSLKRTLGPDKLVLAGTLGTAAALVLYGFAHAPTIALLASLLAGASWIAVLGTLNVSAQVSLPAWVRGRGLAVFAMVLFGAMALGSALWGQVASSVGLASAHFIAAGGAVCVIPLLWRSKLQTGAGADLTPSMHWPEPVLFEGAEKERGPVLVTVEYWVKLQDREPFLVALAKLAAERRRDGAFDWGVFEDAAEEGRFIETFLLDSWIEHLRQHQRVTKADRAVQDLVDRFNTGGIPKVTHFIAAGPGQADG